MGQRLPKHQQRVRSTSLACTQTPCGPFTSRIIHTYTKRNSEKGREEHDLEVDCWRVSEALDHTPSHSSVSPKFPRRRALGYFSADGQQQGAATLSRSSGGDLAKSAATTVEKINKDVTGIAITRKSKHSMFFCSFCYCCLLRQCRE